MDYGLGTTNIDYETGIRYGVISQNSILQAWADSAEPVYPCEDCDCAHDSDCDTDPIGWSYEGDGYEMTDCLDSAVIITKSPFFTFAPFCSPCVPGAGNLDSADSEEPYSDLPQTYCAGHDWFDSGIAPYPVYGVISNRPCFPDAWYGQ